MALHYREFVPRSAALRPLLRCCWSLRGHGGDAAVRRVLPDGCADLLFDLSVRPGIGLWAGTMTRALCLPPASGWTDLFGLRFAPGGLHALLPAAMGSITDAVVALPELPAGWARRLAARLDDCPRARERCAAVAVELRRCAPDAAARRACAALQALAQAPPTRVAALAADWGTSERGLERRFQRWLGVSPKQHLRFLRFERCLQRLGRGGSALDAVAALGYVDQAHLIHEFRAFSGLTPGDWLRDGPAH